MSDDPIINSKEPDMTDNTREDVAQQDICIVPNGTYWAVLDLQRRHVEDGSSPLPAILYSGLESREAAELARREAIGCLLDNGAPFGPSEVPFHFYDLAGRMLRFLRVRNIANAEGLAADLAHAEPWDRYLKSGDPDFEIPF